MNTFKNEKNKYLLSEFLRVAKLLNAEQIKPIIYGSLGLYLLIGEKGVVNDVDMLLLPEDFDKNSQIKKIVLENGFKSDSDHEQEFEAKDYFLSFLSLSDIEKLIVEDEIELTEEEIYGVEFYNFTKETYQKIYAAGLKDKWRKEKKEAGDLEKLRQIEKH